MWNHLHNSSQGRDQCNMEHPLWLQPTWQHPINSTIVLTPSYIDASRAGHKTYL